MVNKKILFYLFIESLNELIIKNVKNYENIAFIYKPKIKNSIEEKYLSEIKKFCKKKFIPLFIENNEKMAKKYNLDGLFISGGNKLIGRGKLEEKLIRIGSAHNQLEYYKKNLQYCETIMLSPIFYTQKYSQNKILNVCRFNLISKNWKSKICALGGMTKNNLKKIKMTKANSIGFISLIKESVKKNPPTIFSRWV
jgi:thiamine monophosphate synthase